MQSYGGVRTFRVDFLTKNILDRVQIWVSTKCWAKKNILHWVENWVLAMNVPKYGLKQGIFVFQKILDRAGFEHQVSTYLY